MRWLLTLFFAKIEIRTNIVLTLITTQIENFKRAIVLSLSFEPSLNADHALSGCMYRELAQVGRYPLAL